MYLAMLNHESKNSNLHKTIKPKRHPYLLLCRRTKSQTELGNSSVFGPEIFLRFFLLLKPVLARPTYRLGKASVF